MEELKLLDKDIPMHMIQDICRRYDVKFSISSENDYIYYHFGEHVRWCLAYGNRFNYNCFLEIVQRLAAKYPDKLKL